MEDVDFDQYSEQSVHFFRREIPEQLSSSFKLFGPDSTDVDVGCGDDHIVWASSETSHTPSGCRVNGVDISPILKRFHSLTGFPGTLAECNRVSALQPIV